MNRLWICIFLFISWTCFNPAVFAGQPLFPWPPSNPFGLSPFWTWKQIETEHFKITYPEELDAITQRAAHLYEQNHALLSPVFQWQPRYKVQVVIADHQDLANGLTSAVGRLGMVLWVSPPGFEQGIAYYDDWLKQLIIHEYSHFLNMDTTSGLFDRLRPLFLDLVLPNSFWPPWMLEGLAVYMETRFTQKGRGRSPYYEAILRSAVEEGSLDTPAFITLDKVNGTNPYFPHGDTRYQFGYHLMNEIAQKHEETLGTLSYESSSGFPTLINTHLYDIQKRDWYTAWQEWTLKTQDRMKNQLSTLHSLPQNPIHWVTQKSHDESHEITGVAFSPDGQWMAYTAVSNEKRQGLYLKNRRTQEIQRLSDKRYGAALKFTPDSQTLIYSEINQLDQFSLRTDLKAYSLKTQRIQFLSHALRAKDPDVSPDGKRVVFTQILPATARIVQAELLSDEASQTFELGALMPLYSPQPYSSVAFPKFSADGKKIYFTEHPNGTPQENLVELDLSTLEHHVLIADGHYNQFPCIHPLSGDVYFVSDLTGVQNLYRYRGASLKPKLITHVTTGLQLPSFDPEGNLYASLLSTSGWDLVQIDPLPGGEKDVDPEKITLSPPPAPPLRAEASPAPPRMTYPSHAYSALGSLRPRAILPLLNLDDSGITLGAQTAGFDAIDLHRYDFSAAYSSRLRVGNISGTYSNRSLGALLSLNGGSSTTVTRSSPSEVLYSRQIQLKASASYLIERTYHQWQPFTSVNFERTFDYKFLTSSGESSLRKTRPFYPSIDLGVQFSNLETSRLAISSEGGQASQLAVRYYALPQLPSWKVFFDTTRYIRLKEHVILSPELKATWVSQFNSIYPFANAVTLGRSAEQILGSFSGDSLGQLSIRGYPGEAFYSQFSLIPSLQLNFPISRVFRGWGTNLAFLDNLSGFTFFDAAILKQDTTRPARFLPSWGGGLQLSTELLFLPVTFSAEFHRGLNLQFKGKSDFFIQVMATGLNF